MSPIYKSPHFGYIDLDKIIAIGPACFIDMMGSGGWFVGFKVTAQLRDEELTYTRELTFDERDSAADGTPLLKFVDGEYKLPEGDPSHFLCVASLQKEVDKFVDVWKTYKRKERS